jgi:hypothetical protein
MPVRRWKNIVLVVLVFGALVYAGRWAYIQVIVIDSCLDRGGRWNYDVGACDGARDAAPDT